MKTITIIILLLLTSIKIISQVQYTGFLGKNPITLVTYGYGDGDVRAYYIYDNYDTPIVINGSFKNKKLTLFERKENGEIFASLVFENKNKDNNILNGKWINLDTNKTYEISLKKDFDIKSLSESKTRELIQSKSTEKHYFKTLIHKSKEDYYARVIGVKIFQKKTDKLLQTIELDCQLLGIDSINIGDYNFDGIQDFSVFEGSSAGPNTTEIYILREIDSDTYYISNITGTSLEFDNESKTIFERNQCCAGSIVTTAEYKIENNEMILIEEHCYIWDDTKEERIERDMKECQ